MYRSRMTDATITVIPVDQAEWEDVARVFGTRGDPAGCWCQWFRLTSAEFKLAPVDELRERMRDQVARRPSPGVLAYLGDEPVGWCAVAPRSEYPLLTSSRIANSADSGDPVAASAAGIWAVTCFVVRVGFRKRGVAGALVRAATDFALEHGAQRIDAFPIDPAARASMSASELYHGTVSLFESAGYEVVARPTRTRAVMRLETGGRGGERTT
jgi:GNAT superfamily N-acetyltransferase